MKFVGMDVGSTTVKAALVDGGRGLASGQSELDAFIAHYGQSTTAPDVPGPATGEPFPDAVFLGCDFGSTTAKAVVLSRAGELLHHSYVMSKGNRIEDAKAILRQIRSAGYANVGGLAITGYGKDLLLDILGADVGIVETVAHATAALHYFPDADVICDVGGCDVKIMLLRQGTVADFRLNSIVFGSTNPPLLPTRPPCRGASAETAARL